ncbi:MAG: hypothetical protein PHY93_18515 [Bacteriovorax sp.]|nr:hypothetical protein [Bacteriovorax sp.]
MNKLVLTFAIAMISSSTFASNACIEQVKAAADKCAIGLSKKIETKHKTAICKEVNFKGITNSGDFQEVKNTVAMLDNKSIAIINYLKVGCQLSYISVTDNAKELLSIAGRGYIRSEEGRIFVIARNAVVTELLNSSGKEYKNLVDIKGNNVGGITLNFEKHDSVELNDTQLFERINDASKNVLLGF